MTNEREKKEELKRDATWSALTAGYLGAGVLGLLTLQGLLEPYRLVVEEHDAHIPRLPKSWQGARVALLADLQIGMFMDNRATVRRAVARTIKERPDLVLLAGDFIHDTVRGIAPVAELLRPLTAAGLPCYAVLGNHDYAMPTPNYHRNDALARRLTEALTDIGVRVLENEAVALESGAGETLYLVGIGEHKLDKDRPLEALSGLPAGAPRIVMMHHPNSFADIPAYAAPFAVAGHTHGGQVRLPFAPGWSLLTRVKEGKVYNDDWIEGHGNPGNHLYVTRGIGFSVAPIRLNCPPELTFFTLKGGSNRVSSR